MKQVGTSLGAAVALPLMGCATMPHTAGPTHPLAIYDWQLVEIVHGGNRPTKLSLEQQVRHTLTFNANGTANMMLDCNRGNADWSATDPAAGNGTLTISKTPSTRALCPPPSYGESMAADLPSAKSFSISPDGRSMTIITPFSVYAFVAMEGTK